jgi:uncharacterized repeat protein (TIGR04076 family)
MEFIMLPEAKCKITVIKRTIHKDIIDEYMQEDMRSYNRCSRFKEGDFFYVTSEFDMPDNFCHWAWADIRKDILAVINGASFKWFDQPNMTISGCTDWFRPVLFRIEKHKGF